jgi:hypothetical protein
MRSSREQRIGGNHFCGPTPNNASEKQRNGTSKEEKPHAPTPRRNRRGGNEDFKLFINKKGFKYLGFTSWKQLLLGFHVYKIRVFFVFRFKLFQHR